MWAAQYEAERAAAAVGPKPLTRWCSLRLRNRPVVHERSQGSRQAGWPVNSLSALGGPQVSGWYDSIDGGVSRRGWTTRQVSSTSSCEDQRQVDGRLVITVIWCPRVQHRSAMAGASSPEASAVLTCCRSGGSASCVPASCTPLDAVKT